MKLKTPTKKPGSPLDAVYRRVDLSPEQIFQALGRLRREAMDEIERLIALVDELDGDVDLEPEPVESNYEGYHPRGGPDQDEAEGDFDDREDVCEDEGAEHDGCEPDVDGEPSLCGIHADSLNRFTT
jgi:hypothetical protein